MNEADLFLSHKIINYLSASYQGRFAALNIYGQLDSKEFTSDELLRVQQGIEKIGGWAAVVIGGEPLFCATWSRPQTPPAQEAMEFLRGLKPDISRLVSKLQSYLGLKDLSAFPEAVKFLIGAFGRYAYSRDSYVRGFIDFGNMFQKPELAAEYSNMLTEVAEELQWVQTFMAGFQGSDPKDPSLYEGLLQEAVLLPGVFRTHIHDLNQLIATYSGAFSYGLAEFSDVEAQAWQRLGVLPIEAGYWRAYGFPADEVARWKNAGILYYKLAVDWRRFGFSPESAAPWFQRDHSVAIARLWSEAGFGVIAAEAQFAQGITDPARAVIKKEDLDEF